jgi:hypothetical protein
LKRGLWNHTSKVFPTYHPIYLWFFIYGFAENPSFSASYDLWKGVYDTVNKKFLQVIIQIIYRFYFVVCRERVFSLHPIIFEKGSMKPYIKSFSNLSSKLFIGFILWFVEKGYNKPEYYATVQLLVNPDTQSGHLIRTIGPSVLVLRSSCFGPRASVLVLRSSCFGPHMFCPTYMEGSVTRNEWGIEVLLYKGFSCKNGYYQNDFTSYQPNYLWVCRELLFLYIL